MNNLSKIKETVHSYDKLRERLVKIIFILDRWQICFVYIRNIKFFNKDTKNYANICYNIADNYNCDIMEVIFENKVIFENNEHTSYIPVDWLFLDEVSLRDVVEQELKRRKEAQEKAKQQEKEAKIKKIEEIERREYERLKAKFEK